MTKFLPCFVFSVWDGIEDIYTGTHGALELAKLIPHFFTILPCFFVCFLFKHKSVFKFTIPLHVKVYLNKDVCASQHQEWCIFEVFTSKKLCEQKKSTEIILKIDLKYFSHSKDFKLQCTLKNIGFKAPSVGVYIILSI